MIKLPFIILLITISVSCNFNSDNISTEAISAKDSIHLKILEDLADGLSHPNTILVDERHLPKNKWVAERGYSSISFQTRH